MTGPECTCDEGRHGVTRQFGNEPHYAGCPRWGTPLGGCGWDSPGADPLADLNDWIQRTWADGLCTPAELREQEPLRVESERADRVDAEWEQERYLNGDDVEPVRPSWDEYGLGLARAVAARADCTRRRVGAVIIDAEHRVVATGYNGAPAGQPGCLTDGACPRGRLTYDQQPGMIGYDLQRGRCDALHAEMNAVIYAGRDRAAGGTLYCTDEPCHMCSLVIAAAGIDRVVVA